MWDTSIQGFEEYTNASKKRLVKDTKTDKIIRKEIVKSRNKNGKKNNRIDILENKRKTLCTGLGFLEEI